MRLIDGEQLEEIIYKYCCNPCRRQECDRCRGCKANSILKLMKALCSIVEAKPVVYCKDCEYFNPHCQSCFLHWQEDDEPNVFCFQTNPDDYCSFAEKRDNK